MLNRDIKSGETMRAFKSMVYITPNNWCCWRTHGNSWLRLQWTMDGELQRFRAN